MRPYPLRADELVEDVVSELDQATETVRARFGGLSHEQLAWQPGPKSWGVGHCLVHVARTNQLYREALSAALRAAGPEAVGSGGVLRGKWFGRVFTGLVGPDPKIRVRSPEIVRPRQKTVETASVETFLAEQQRVRLLAGEAGDVNLDAVVVRSPLSSWVQLTAGDALRVMVAHELRHLQQAHRIVDRPDFPR